MSLTITGEVRERYSQTVEQRPSRFSDPDAHGAWVERADAWADAQYGERVACVGCGGRTTTEAVGDIEGVIGPLCPGCVFWGRGPLVAVE